MAKEIEAVEGNFLYFCGRAYLIVIFLSAIALGSSVFKNEVHSAFAIKNIGNGEVERPLVRLTDEKGMNGVCTGIAYKVGVEPWIPRIIFVITGVTGAGVIVYAIMSYYLESAETPDDYDRRIVLYRDYI